MFFCFKIGFIPNEVVCTLVMIKFINRLVNELQILFRIFNQKSKIHLGLICPSHELERVGALLVALNNFID